MFDLKKKSKNMKAFLRWLWVRLSFNFISEYKKSIKSICEGQNIETNSTCHGMHNSLGVKRLNNVKGSHSLCNAKADTKRHVIWYQNLDLLLVHEDGNGDKKIQSLQNARPRQRYKVLIKGRVALSLLHRLDRSSINIWQGGQRCNKIV
jgi:hypothetical protein